MKFQQILLREMSRRVDGDAHYSLRAFARDLGLSPSGLSEILKEKKGLSRNKAAMVAMKLGLSVEESKLFLQLVQGREVEATQAIDLEKFEVIAGWIHFAVLELMETKDFQRDLNWIAGRLGVSVKDASDAIHRLETVGLLRRTEESWVGFPGDLNLADAAFSRANIEHHRQILHRAEAALSTTEEDREFGAVTMAFSRTDVEKAVEELQRFRRKFAMDFQQSEVKDEVYCFSMQFFPLTK